jgi:HlyD family secretion protein
VELTGQVESIAPAAVIQSGVVLYPVTIGLTASDLPLRPGMTADATIVVESREKTLIVPFRAIETADGQAYVTRITDATRTRTPVTLGLITEVEVEILDGLAEGDRVAVYANPVQDAGLQSGPGGMFSGGQ